MIDRDDSNEHQVSKLVTLQRGVLTAEVQHIKRKKLTMTSRLHKDTKVYIRHTETKGWITLEAPEHYWRIGDAHLYEIQLKAGDWPLYRFGGDAAKGDVNGQGSGGKWFATAPDGKLIKS